MRDIADPHSRAGNRAPSPDEAIEFLRTQSLATIVEREIERMIMSGELTAGERLNENALAARLSVSRGPVREACRKLEQGGLLEVVVNRGVFVRKLDVAQALELKEIRAALIPLVARKIITRITPAEIAELAGLVDRMDGPARAGDLESYFPINLEFHAKLMVFTGSPRLAEIYLGMNRELQLFRRQSLMTAEALLASNAEHRRIVDELRAGNVEGTIQAMLAHSNNSRDRLIKVTPDPEKRLEGGMTGDKEAAPF